VGRSAVGVERHAADAQPEALQDCLFLHATRPDACRRSQLGWCVHARTRARAHTHTHTHSSTHKHAYTYIYMHTHTHTHTYHTHTYRTQTKGAKTSRWTNWQRKYSRSKTRFVDISQKRPNVHTRTGHVNAIRPLKICIRGLSFDCTLGLF
jgi:hypothetical protein